MDLRNAFAEDAWRYPIAAGLGSVPFTVLCVRVTELPSILPVFLAGGVVGYVFGGRGVPGRRVGWRTGLVGSVAVLPKSVRFVSTIPDYSWSLPFSLLAGLLAVLFVGIFVTVFGGFGALGGHVGGWLDGSSDAANASLG
jgi:hypothetical protein